MVLLNSPKYDQEMIMPDFRLKNIDNNYLNRNLLKGKSHTSNVYM